MCDLPVAKIGLVWLPRKRTRRRQKMLSYMLTVLLNKL